MFLYHPKFRGSVKTNDISTTVAVLVYSYLSLYRPYACYYLDRCKYLLVSILVRKLSAQCLNQLAFGFRFGSFGRQRQNHRASERRRHVIETVISLRLKDRRTHYNDSVQSAAITLFSVCKSKCSQAS